ncbi:MAG: glycosyltransferase [Planctomycetaceae bacterium]|nr:glycosyltransferase [Planctomycetaceae bacterium]
MAAKITMIIPTLVQGGAEKQMSLLAAGLPKTEFDVRVIALTAGGPWEKYLLDHQVPVRVIGKRFKFDPFSFYSLYRELKQEKPDLIHTWIFAANSYGRVAGRLAGVPVRVVGERCVDLWKNEFHFWLDRFLERWTDAIVTNSQGVVDFYQQHRIGLNKFHVIPNGSWPQGVADPHARQNWRERLKLPQDAVIATSLARLWPQKKLKDLIWAIDLLNCKYQHVHLVIAGDGPERQRLQQFACEAKVADRVHFLGHLSSADSLLQASDLFCLVSEYEGQSNSLMEAIHWRIPAVVSDIAGNRDLIPDVEHGYLCPVGDRIAIAKQMVAALESPEEARSRAVRAAERLGETFGSKRMIDDYAVLYRRLLEQRD